jgi:hypothetical protein
VRKKDGLFLNVFDGVKYTNQIALRLAPYYSHHQPSAIIGTS